MSIKDYIIEQLKEEDARGGVPFLRNYIRVSGAGQCLRKRRFAMLNEDVTEEKTINSLLTTTFGHIAHQYFQDILARRFGTHFICEKRLVNPKWKLTGAFDGILYDIELNKYILLDFKTTHPYKIKYLKEQQSADINHIKQLAVYDWLIHQPETKILEVVNGEARLFPIENYPLVEGYKNSKRELRVVYIMRDAITIHEYVYNPESEEIKKLLQQELRDIAEVKKLPAHKQKTTQNTWECKYCPYLTKCEEVSHEDNKRASL